MSNMLFAVSGASRGLGRAICSVLANSAPRAVSRLDFFIFARTKSGLEETKQMILSLRADSKVTIVPMDFTHPNESLSVIRAALQHPQRLYYDRTVLINNVGQIDPIKPLMKAFISIPSADRTVVNISSIAALTPLKSMAVYSAVKAASDSLHRSLAAEYETVRVLNYAPGPLRTTMFQKICETHPDKEEKQIWQKLYETALDPMDSATRLVDILERRNFKSGDHIDYFDNPAEQNAADKETEKS